MKLGPGSDTCLSKALNHYCFVLGMECKAVGPVCCVMHQKEPSDTYHKEKGFAPVFLARSGSSIRHLTLYTLQGIVLLGIRLVKLF